VGAKSRRGVKLAFSEEITTKRRSQKRIISRHRETHGEISLCYRRETGARQEKSDAHNLGVRNQKGYLGERIRRREA